MSAPWVIRHYDTGQDGVEKIGTRLLGRLAFTGLHVDPSDAADLLAVDAEELWIRIPHNATLAEADPSVTGGLYDDAEYVHRRYLRGVPYAGPGTLSAALHLCRPGLFPVLSVGVRQVYERAAVEEWTTSTKEPKPHTRRRYWPVIRRDILANAPALEHWRERLSAHDLDAARLAANLTDVRLWGLAVTVLAQPHAR